MAAVGGETNQQSWRGKRGERSRVEEREREGRGKGKKGQRSIRARPDSEHPLAGGGSAKEKRQAETRRRNEKPAISAPL